jgi:hypothetical protein
MLILHVNLGRRPQRISESLNLWKIAGAGTPRTRRQSEGLYEEFLAVRGLMHVKARVAAGPGPAGRLYSTDGSSVPNSDVVAGCNRGGGWAGGRRLRSRVLLE